VTREVAPVAPAAVRALPEPPPSIFHDPSPAPSREQPVSTRQVAATRGDQPVAARGGAAPMLRDPAPPIPLRPLNDHRRAIRVVSHDESSSLPAARPAPLSDAHLIAVGYKADERAGVFHYVTLRIRGERIEIPCDRETADSFAATMSAGKSLRYKISLEPLE
jgi:hypothetical protein